MSEATYVGNVKAEIKENGSFVRQKNLFTTPFGEKDGELKAEAGRYKLYWAKKCHWSNRSSIVIELLGLGDAIDVQIVGQERQKGSYAWTIYDEEGKPEPVSGYRYLYEYYEAAKPGFQGRATVPALVDQRTKTVVNNDHHRLTNYFEVNFKPFQKKDAPDLYPEGLREEIDALNEWLYHNINNGVYRMMFARSLAAYDEASKDFWGGMDYLEERLKDQRFLFGDYVTDSDVRLYVTLVRLETSYYRFLGPVARGLRGYRHLYEYARDLYEIPAFKNNTYFKDIARDYGDVDESQSSYASYNYRFWNEINFEKKWGEPQNRRKLSRTPERKFLISVS